MKAFYLFIIAILLASACSSTQQTFTPISSPTETFTPLAEPTISELPNNLVEESSEYCQPPYAALPLVSAVDLSEDEIVRALMVEWLNRYKNSQAHPYCRIEDYRIDDVLYDPKISSLSLEPKGDFMRMVKFSVKLIQIPSDWMSFAGELDQENWMSIGQYVSISAVGDDYVMVFANP